MSAHPVAADRHAALAVLTERLLDDAAIFPPGEAQMAEAVSAHLRWLAGARGPVLGPFVCPLAWLGELAEALAGQDGAGRLELAVVVPAGTGDVHGRLADFFGTSAQAALCSLEVALGAGELASVARLGQLASLASFAAVWNPGGGPVDVFVEPPSLPTRPEELEPLAGLGLRAKLRTGGPSKAAFPGEIALARAIAAAVGAAVAFKCTAGLHRAVRHLGEDGFEHHGFCNVLVAARRAAGGAALEAVVEALGVRDGHRLAEELAALDPDEALALRRAFTSFGTCSVAEPLDDLARLGLSA